jgi:tRNA A37 methylthiotransferase MiaB
MELVQHARNTIPGLSVSSDIIAGFCGETEEEHRDTVSLMATVRFDQAFMFAYSLRDKTHADRTMTDDVEEETKQRRLREIIDTYRDALQAKNGVEELGQLRLVLVEGQSLKSTPENPVLTGRTCANKVRTVSFLLFFFLFPSFSETDFSKAK